MNKILLCFCEKHTDVASSCSNVSIQTRVGGMDFPFDEKDFVPQSGHSNDIKIIKIADNTKSQNVAFMDHAGHFKTDPSGDLDDTFKLQDSDELPLNEFFKRPLRISNITWNVGVGLATSFDPWSLYFNNPRVVNRISNYKLLRAKLHVKFVVNGNGFYYGRALASYHPARAFDAYVNSTLVPEDAVIESQRPHVFIDPTNSQGGDMILPFFWRNNYMDIVAADWVQMGDIDVRSLPVLKHANGDTTPVTISVYAWCEEIEFAGITQYEPATIVPQVGTEVDEANKDGFISKPATALASMAGQLENVPVIGKYATATSTMAGAVADVARNFGYCRPPVTENPGPRRLHPISSLAVTNVPDTAQKLTTDDKQELSIDPSIMNLPSTDCFNIKEIAKKETYLTNFTWEQGSTGFLWNARVQPMLWRALAGPPAQAWFPACAFAAMPFENWSGAMKFRFQVVCSAFHRGRLRIVFDPTGSQNVPELNTAYTHIVDISDTQDFTVEVPHMQTRTLLRRLEPPFDSVTEGFSTTPLGVSAIGNGTIAVYGETILTSPNNVPNNDITINVFISMGDDFEVYNPGNGFQYYGFMPQSGTELHPVSNTTEELNAPLKSESELIGGQHIVNDKIPLVYMGESIKSFRTLLKRYNCHRRDAISFVANYNGYHGVRPQFPALRGQYLGAVDSVSGGGQYMYVNQLLLHWVRHAFMGHRGSIRYKILMGLNSSNRTNIQGVVTRRRFDENNNWSDIRAALPANTSQSRLAHDWIFGGPFDYPDGTQGVAYMNAMVNPTVEFEVPWENSQRCFYGRLIDYTDTGTPYNTTGYKFALAGSFSNRDFMETWVATGEDFQCYFFVGLPRLYQYLEPPEPSAT
jgi:hypothetical protein